MEIKIPFKYFLIKLCSEDSCDRMVRSLVFKRNLRPVDTWDTVSRSKCLDLNFYPVDKTTITLCPTTAHLNSGSLMFHQFHLIPSHLAAAAALGRCLLGRWRAQCGPACVWRGRRWRRWPAASCPGPCCGPGCSRSRCCCRSAPATPPGCRTGSGSRPPEDGENWLKHRHRELNEKWDTGQLRVWCLWERVRIPGEVWQLGPAEATGRCPSRQPGGWSWQALCPRRRAGLRRRWCALRSARLRPPPLPLRPPSSSCCGRCGCHHRSSDRLHLRTGIGYGWDRSQMKIAPPDGPRRENTMF